MGFGGPLGEKPEYWIPISVVAFVLIPAVLSLILTCCLKMSTQAEKNMGTEMRDLQAGAGGIAPDEYEEYGYKVRQDEKAGYGNSYGDTIPEFSPRGQEIESKKSDRSKIASAASSAPPAPAEDPYAPIRGSAAPGTGLLADSPRSLVEIVPQQRLGPQGEPTEPNSDSSSDGAPPPPPPPPPGPGAPGAQAVATDALTPRSKARIQRGAWGSRAKKHKKRNSVIALLKAHSGSGSGSGKVDAGSGALGDAGSAEDDHPFPILRPGTPSYK